VRTAIESLLGPYRVVPVCGRVRPADASPLAGALVAGGLPLVEVTLRSPDALEGLAAVAAQPGLVVGAGTVRTARQLRDAVDAGARFVVSPCLTESLAVAALELGVPFLPGVATATEVQLAVEAGFAVVKFFPAESAGGLAAVAALAGPFPEVRFVPTGGVSAANAAAYLEHPSVLAVGGSWMLPESLRAVGDWDGLTIAISDASALARQGARV
jgi:2-dehydro-3-deoxyphosphogluconate aldolase/(4S)-4-hydroxy-2-oxoglutarate aldolase